MSNKILNPDVVQKLDEHLSEMSDGDEVIIRRAEGKWVIINSTGAFIFHGSGETLEEAYDEFDIS